MKPIANFTFVPTELSVQFTDSSIGVPTSWLWNFGYNEAGNPKTSTLQNPTIVFPTEGVYKVVLVSTNGEGDSAPFLFNLLIHNGIGLSLTIADMVRCNIPVGLAVDTICFNNSRQTWQLYLQNFMKPVISDADVFDESKWPPMANVLISRLIIYDIILSSATSSMAAYYATLKSYQSNQTSTNTVLVADYTTLLPSIEFDQLVVNSILINGISTGPFGGTTYEEVIAWLSGLGKGNFYMGGLNLRSDSNSNVISNINITYTVGLTNPGYNLSFTRSNEQIIAVDQLVITEGTSPDMMTGGIRYMETGPSKTEWYDGSRFWQAMLQKGGAFDKVTAELCGFGRRVGVNLPMCPIIKRGVPIFVTGSSKGRGCGCNFLGHGDNKPPSRG